MKQWVPITSKSSKFKGETQHYVVKLPKSAGARHYCPKILRVPGTLGTHANSSPDKRKLSSDKIYQFFTGFKKEFRISFDNSFNHSESERLLFVVVLSIQFIGLVETFVKTKFGSGEQIRTCFLISTK